MRLTTILIAASLLLASGAAAAAEEGPTRQELLTMIEMLRKRNWNSV